MKHLVFFILFYFSIILTCIVSLISSFFFSPPNLDALLSMNLGRYIHISISQSIKSVGYIFTSNYICQRNHTFLQLSSSQLLSDWVMMWVSSNFLMIPLINFPRCQDCFLAYYTLTFWIFFPWMSSLIKAHGFEICLAEIQTEVIFFSETVRYKRWISPYHNNEFILVSHFIGMLLGIQK